MRFILLFLLLFCFNAIAQSGAFGPRETKLILDGAARSVEYRIDNTDKKLPWLVQAWVEDADEKKVSSLIAVPMVFRVEASSVFSVKITKSGQLSEDKETLFWAVSNSLPGGLPTKQEKQEGKISAKLSLAYRFKVPLIYRPEALKNIPQQPDKLVWSKDAAGAMTVHNPTRFIVQLHNVVVDKKKHQGTGVSYLLLPSTTKTLGIKPGAGSGTRIKYGVVNDYGAVKEYEGIVK